MKKKFILLSLLFIIFILLFGISSKAYAADLDEIVNYIVTVEPRMNDGSLDITYEITWKVLDSTTEGPLEWVKIGTPNENFDTPTAISNNIKSIRKYNGAYVRIDFNQKYYEGEQVTFKYSIHQSYMYKISWGKCKYEFTPAWFTDAKVDNITVKWNKDEVKKSNSKKSEDNYLIWNKTAMAKGEKLSVTVEYDKKAFSSLTSSKQRNSDSSSGMGIVIFVIIIVIIIASIGGRGGGGYYRHRGFYGGPGPRYYGGGCVRSSCACACAHSSCASSCACACAGSGRAGCSRKDFYGTNLSSKKIKNVMKESKKEGEE